MRTALLALCRLILRIFFRDIEVVGRDRVPTAGPVMFVVNHPNGLIDPLFVLCLTGRRVSFLAKAPLFRMFVVGAFVRAFECLPVYRKQDGADPAKNRASIEQSVALLRRGNAIAIFPEGTSHSDPQLKPLKPGAARMALRASASNLATGEPPVQVVPIGLTYTRKSTFRSRALMVFGPPVPAPQADLDGALEPAPPLVAAYTDALRQALADVTLQAPSTEALCLARRVERVLLGHARDEGQADETLHARHRLQQRLVDGYAQLQDHATAALDALRRRVEAFEARMASLGLSPAQQVVVTPRVRVLGLLRGLALALVLVPLAVLGFLLNYATYRVVGALAFRLSKQEDDVVATFKAVGGLCLFPVTWILLASIGGALWGAWAVFVALLGGPLGGWAALLVAERGTRVLARSYALALLTLRPGVRRWIVEERRAIRAAVLALADASPRDAASANA